MRIGAWFDDDSTERVDLRDLMGSSGFATYGWKVSDVPDGEYQLRVKTDCAYEGTLDDEFNWGSTPILNGVIDTVKPELFSNIGFGDIGAAPISITFTEPIRCDFVTFGMTVPAYTNIDISLEKKCSGSTLQLAPYHMLWRDYPGSIVELTVQDVFDVAGNAFESTSLTYSFTVTQDWTCTTPTHCNDGSGQVYCDYNDDNHFCTLCDSGWSGDDCTASNRGILPPQSVHAHTPRQLKVERIESLRSSIAHGEAQRKLKKEAVRVLFQDQNKN